MVFCRHFQTWVGRLRLRPPASAGCTRAKIKCHTLTGPPATVLRRRRPTRETRTPRRTGCGRRIPVPSARPGTAASVFDRDRPPRKARRACFIDGHSAKAANIPLGPEFLIAYGVNGRRSSFSKSDWEWAAMKAVGSPSFAVERCHFVCLKSPGTPHVLQPRPGDPDGAVHIGVSGGSTQAASPQGRAKGAAPFNALAFVNDSRPPLEHSQELVNMVHRCYGPHGGCRVTVSWWHRTRSLRLRQGIYTRPPSLVSSIN